MRYLKCDNLVLFSIVIRLIITRLLIANEQHEASFPRIRTTQTPLKTLNPQDNKPLIISLRNPPLIKIRTSPLT